MKNSVWKSLQVGVMSLGLAVGAAGVAYSQGGTGGGGDTGSGRTTDTRGDRGFDWGWLGLIGLAGLLPLFTRRNGNGHADRYGHTTGRSTTAQ